jgi:hypothetical protein
MIFSTYRAALTAAFVALAQLQAASAQEPDAAARLRLVAAHLATLERFHVDIKVTTHGPDASSERTLKASIRKLGVRQIKSFEHLTFLSAPNALIVVDHARKEIHYQSGEKSDKPGMQSPSETIEGLDKQGLLVTVSETPDALSYLISNRTTTVAKISVERGTLLLRRVEYPAVPQSHGRTIVEYEWRDAATLTPEDFSEERFVLNKAELTPAPALAGYRVIQAKRMR